MTKGQQAALEQLKEIAAASDNLLEIVDVVPLSEAGAPLKINISLNCSHYEQSQGGLPLRARERLIISIPADFPFNVPSVDSVHDRFAGFPHVQWKRHFCIYLAPSTEWSPRDGMFGFFDRLNLWLERMARGEFDAYGGPLHPPVAYASSKTSVIPRIDTPEVRENAWLGYAGLDVISDYCCEIKEWNQDVAKLVKYPLVAPTFLLAEPMPMEYPGNVRDLLVAIFDRGISPRDVLYQLFLPISFNKKLDQPLFVMLGSPMRGISGGAKVQHLTAWQFPHSITTSFAQSLERFFSKKQDEPLDSETFDKFMKWAEEGKVSWCRVREERPEVTKKREADSHLAVFHGKTIALWGCGALGSPVAEMLARAGAGKLILRDSKTVGPGLLCRQLYNYRDIGRPKVESLKERLQLIDPKLQVDIHYEEILSTVLDSPDWTDGADILVDTTAANSILVKLERQRLAATKSVPIVSMAIGHDATVGLVTISKAEHSGGPLDVWRAAKLAACHAPELRGFADEFWPTEPRGEVFQPEPGCSEPTFTGDAGDTISLAARLLTLAAKSLAQNTDSTAFAHLVDFSDASAPTSPKTRSFSWSPEIVLRDPYENYDVRLSGAAWNEVLAWIRKNARSGISHHETGGILLGELDEAANVIWITDVSGPPKDSRASANEFVCGTSGLKEINDHKRNRSRGSVTYLGMWHTHPKQSPKPSTKDFQAMHRLLNPSEQNPPRHSVMFIVGGFSPMYELGAYVFTRSTLKGPPPKKGGQPKRIPEMKSTTKRIGLAFSGGGSRAMAFHLGCLRALHDRGLLGQVQVISGVSGGAVLGAMYAYSDDTFEEFDKRVCKRLKRGFVWASAFNWRALVTVAGSFFTLLIAGAAATIFAVFRKQPPIRRWTSRANLLRNAFNSELSGKKLTDPTRNGIGVVFSATDLRTGSAFRFGNRESGLWRFNRIVLADNSIPVADAIITSAAYPILLPSLDRAPDFKRKDDTTVTERVILADGGVFENLGVGPMEPGRNASISTNTYSPPYIIACNAGAGIFDDGTFPFWWASRMIRSFETTFRKLQDSAMKRMHDYRATGQLSGFLHPYLGQLESAMPYNCPDFVTRNQVKDYPTDFSAMRDTDLDLLTRRGEEQTRFLINYYCPEL